MAQVIVVGGGLAGMSAAHTAIQAGAKVLVLDKSAFCGGNSTKATSGINAAGSRTQRALGIDDAAEVFEADTNKSAAELCRPNLTKALTHQSGPAVDWLMDSFGLDLNVCSRLAAHSHPRTHRGGKGGQFPGMMITYGLMEALDDIAANSEQARVVQKATVKELIQDDSGKVIGCRYEKDGAMHEEHGPVLLSTGGFGADFTDDSLLSSVEQKWRDLEVWKTEPGLLAKLPQLRSLSTTNGPHCTGDGIKLATGIGADVYDLHCVQVHPTGLVDPRDPSSKVKWLAAEALRGHGGLLLDNEGKRFCNELGKRDYVTGRMWNHEKGPYRLVLSEGAASEIDWHCKHYKERGLMRALTGAQLAAEMGVSESTLKQTFDTYREQSAAQNQDPWGKLYCNNPPTGTQETFHVAQVMPLVHYTMGGIATDEFGQILDKNEQPLPGLFGAGEVLGGIHGANRLGGSSLLDCVVYGRLAGKSAAQHLLAELIAEKESGGLGSRNPIQANISLDPDSGKVSVEFDWGAKAASAPAPTAAPPAIEDAPKPVARMLTLQEVAAHNEKEDCWVVIGGEVFDVTDFLDDHPGGKNAILIYGGKDATDPFNMMHKPEIIDKYAMEYHVGTLVQSKL